MSRKQSDPTPISAFFHSACSQVSRSERFGLRGSRVGATAGANDLASALVGATGLQPDPRGLRSRSRSVHLTRQLHVGVTVGGCPKMHHVRLLTCDLMLPAENSLTMTTRLFSLAMGTLGGPGAGSDGPRARLPDARPDDGMTRIVSIAVRGALLCLLSVIFVL